MTLAVHPFAKRQTPDSHHSHFDGTWDELATLVKAYWSAGVTSPNNPGVQLVPMPPELVNRFFCNITPMTEEIPLQVSWQSRMPHEAPFFQITSPVDDIQSAKFPAKKVDIICYRHDILAADNDIPSDCLNADYYLININAYANDAPEPMHPTTMARNLLGLPGGTVPPVPYTPKEFAESIMYWNQHVKLSPSPNS